MASRSQACDLITNYVPDFECYLRGRIFPQSSHEIMLPSCTFTKVKRLRKLIITTFYLMLLTNPTSAFPSQQQSKPETTVTEHKDRISVQTTGCRQLSNQELRAQMEANDEDDNVGNVHNYDKEIEDLGAKAEDSASVQHKLIMRRKRSIEQENTNLTLDKKFLYQNMIFFSLPQRESRYKRSASTDIFHPAWECKKTKIWLKMKDGYFPSRILDGSCRADTCFFGMYTCNPVRRTTKVLKRDPTDACKPVPLFGQNTTYEESWILERVHVTVACECGLPEKKNKQKAKP